MSQRSLPAQAVDVIRSRAPGFEPKIGVVLGYSSARFAEEVTDVIHISYTDLPGFPQLDVEGHEGEMMLGYLNGKGVLCLKGRAHRYETRDYETLLPAFVLVLGAQDPLKSV